MARHLSGRGLFAAVTCGFLKQAPRLEDVLAGIQTPNISVVPMLSGHGYITDSLIPEALGVVAGHIKVHLCDPLGCHLGVANIMAQRAQSVIAAQNFKPDQASILIAAHGNSTNPQNSDQAKDLASRIEALCGGVPTRAAFIEEHPYIGDWHATTTVDNLIVLPFLIGGGPHEAKDIPAMLGLDHTDPAFDILSDHTPFIGPLKAHGRTIWCCRALGFEPALGDLIVDLASQQ